MENDASPADGVVLDVELEQRLRLGPLSPAERRLIASLITGEVADVHDDGPDQPGPDGRTGGRGHVRATLIRMIMLGRVLPFAEIDPHGLRLTGAHLHQRLDLDELTSPLPLVLIDCHLTEGLSAARASLHTLHLTDGTTVRCTDPEQPALDAGGLKLAHDLRLQCDIAGDSPRGAIVLLSASIGGHLDCEDGTVANVSGFALDGYGMSTGGGVFLQGTLSGAGEDGAVRLAEASIGGPLDCTGGTLTNETGPALAADGLGTGGDAFLRGTFTGAGKDGAVRLPGARVGGQLDCTGGTLTNQTGPALHADTLSTGGSAGLMGTFTGAGEDGAVRLLGAKIGGQLDCTGGTLTNQTGPALHADTLSTDGHAFLDGKFTGDGEAGAVGLTGAKIGGQLTCTEGILTNQTGPALAADGLSTGSDAGLMGTFTGAGENGVVRLRGARIGGQLRLSPPGSVSWSPVPAAPPPSSSSSAPEQAPAPVVWLQAATVTGNLFLSPSFAAAGTPARWLALGGLTYRGLPLGTGRVTRGAKTDVDQSGVDQWLQLLAKHTTGYAAQPWQHLAAAHRAVGHERDAKKILIAQQDDRRRRILRPPGPRWKLWRQPWRRVRYHLMWWSKWLTGYGYKTSWTLAWLLGWTVLSIGLALGTALVHADTLLKPDPDAPAQVVTRKVAAHGRTTLDPGGLCSPGERIGLGLEWALPFVRTGASGTCVLNTTDPAGQWVTAASWGVQAGG
ncbi:hypothetical protein, partial [Kineococcus indalonis]|uniref:hypothetical protein n=1 Tax=Kineococcus indalonis TaxID=2696566 RepID=UPI0014124354